MGPPGYNGHMGVQGLRGPQGWPGAPGRQGTPGPPGIQGPRGVQGWRGPTGPMGMNGVPGRTGPSGPAGLQGPGGEQGPTGAPGPNGRYGPVGPQGTTGLPGLMGTTGENGAPGVQGVPVMGAQGAPGPAGTKGPDGKDGAPGLPGKQGTPGTIGINGAPGQPGQDGPNGVRGKNGITPSLAAAECRVGDLFPTPHHWINAQSHQGSQTSAGSGQGWCYTPRQEARTFSEAEHVCRAWGGHVFSYQTEQEMDMAVRLFGHTHFWIGMRRMGSSGGLNGMFRFTDATDNQYANTRWASGQPSNSGGQEYCVEMVWYRKMQDVRCDARLPFICKRQSD
mmetsp:Transcript_19556/g.46421  ORF Transcript_19556/g.46421 Transcript_19556/m.46421 type:complete len:336 (+) Transcript_19556:2-1009(+)